MSRRVVRLPILDTTSERGFVEKLEVDEVGKNRYRLVHTPGLLEGMAAGDEFELLDTESGFRVLHRGGNLGVWFFFDPGSQDRGTLASRLGERVTSIGGRLDGGGSTILVFTIPFSSGFDEVERVFESSSKETPGSTWMYCNVYGRDGSTPHNWWLNRSASQ